MKTYAKIGIDNEVIQVAVLSDDFSDNAGLQFMKDTTGSENWLICNETVGKGDTWDKSKNAFIKAQPFPSWTLNKTTYQWEAPITDPGDDYYWNEDAYQADNSKGWILFPR